PRLTETQSTHLVEVAQAVADGALVAVAGDTGWTLEVPEAAAEALTDAHGKGTVRDTGKTVADELGQTKPRSAADVSSDPLLFALTRGHLTNQHKENQR
ncbi:MAG: hypothetical protein U5R31_03215, partial [Acidimicrobiia bacterium]|nr:hypothetical protein [Acidimicrobiia bacterium]